VTSNTPVVLEEEQVNHMNSSHEKSLVIVSTSPLDAVLVSIRNALENETEILLIYLDSLSSTADNFELSESG
jgi:hypothetical protein